MEYSRVEVRIQKERIKMLNYDDCEMLLEALDALQSKGGMNNLLTGMLRISFSSSPEDAENEKNSIMREMDENKDKEEQLRKRITLLKAKIIQIEDSLAVEDMRRFAEE